MGQAGRPARGGLRLGRVAILSAIAEIEAGRYDCVLVLGGGARNATCRGADAPKHLGAAAWIGHEGQDAKFMWPYMFSRLADEYDRRYGLNDTHLHAIAELNMRNAKANPIAQTRDWTFGPGGFTDDDHDNPVVEGRLRRTDCAQVTDGAAGVLLVSDRYRAERLGGKPSARILGWGHRTAALPLQAKLDRSQGRALRLPARPPGRHRRVPAGPRSPTSTRSTGSRPTTASPCREYMAIDHFGITEPGESWKAVENGELERDGAIPVNPSGGLIGVGHPVGATGVRMLLDAARRSPARPASTRWTTPRRSPR